MDISLVNIKSTQFKTYLKALNFKIKASLYPDLPLLIIDERVQDNHKSVLYAKHNNIPIIIKSDFFPLTIDKLISNNIEQEFLHNLVQIPNSQILKAKKNTFNSYIIKKNTIEINTLSHIYVYDILLDGLKFKDNIFKVSNKNEFDYYSFYYQEFLFFYDYINEDKWLITYKKANNK